MNDFVSGEIIRVKSELLGVPLGAVVQDDRGFRYEVVGTEDEKEFLNFLTGDVVESSGLSFPVEFIG